MDQPDRQFADPRLASIYDAVNGDRTDLIPYVERLDRLEARSVLDVGCGTGTLACRLARSGRSVVAVDPAGASLDVARAKPGADRVRWIEGDASALPADLAVDGATMTGNVAQVFVTDGAWASTLAAIARAIRPGGSLVFETRDPRRRGWEEWNRTESWRRIDLGPAGTVDYWVELVSVDEPLVSFRSHYRFEPSDQLLTSDSTLRFRSRSEVESSLAAAGFAVTDVGDAPDRPGRELVFVAQVS